MMNFTGWASEVEPWLVQNGDFSTLSRSAAGLEAFSLGAVLRALGAVWMRSEEVVL